MALEKPDGGILPLEERKKKKQGSKRKKDKESGVSRGIDFQHVSNVINFDFPLDVNSYVHRAGRTARGNNQVRQNKLILWVVQILHIMSLRTRH